MDPVNAVVLAMLGTAAALVLVRLVRGPSMLDRAVALDVLLAVAVAGLGTQAAATRSPFSLPILLVLSFLGFTGSVGIARFISLRDETTARGEGDSEGGGRTAEGAR